MASFYVLREVRITMNLLNIGKHVSNGVVLKMTMKKDFAFRVVFSNVQLIICKYLEIGLQIQKPIMKIIILWLIFILVFHGRAETDYNHQESEILNSKKRIKNLIAVNIKDKTVRKSILVTSILVFKSQNLDFTLKTISSKSLPNQFLSSPRNMSSLLILTISTLSLTLFGNLLALTLYLL